LNTLEIVVFLCPTWLHPAEFSRRKQCWNCRELSSRHQATSQNVVPSVPQLYLFDLRQFLQIRPESGFVQSYLSGEPDLNQLLSFQQDQARWKNNYFFLVIIRRGIRLQCSVEYSVLINVLLSGSIFASAASSAVLPASDTVLQFSIGTGKFCWCFYICCRLQRRIQFCCWTHNLIQGIRSVLHLYSVFDLLVAIGQVHEYNLQFWIKWSQDLLRP